MARLAASHRSALLAALVSSGTALAAEESLTFRYAPPTDTRYTLVLKSTTTRELDGIGRQTSEFQSRTAVTIARSGDGYAITAQPVSVRVKRDGRDVEDPVLAALQDVVTVHRLDATGRLLDVEGYDDLAEQLRARLPAEVVDALAPAVDRERLVAEEKAEWQGRVGAFLGRTVQIGEVLKGTSRVAVAGAILECDVETRVAGRVPCGDGSCVRLSSAYREAGVPGDDSALRIHGGSEWVVDPETMLIFSESASRTTETDVDLPGRGRVHAVTVEQREYRYEYH